MAGRKQPTPVSTALGNESGDSTVAGGNVGIENGPVIDVGSGQQAVDPAIAFAAGDGETGNGDAPKRGRGRPVGSGNRKAKAENPADLGALTAVIVNIHAMLATRVPEMLIEEKEAATLAASIIRVEQYYPKVRELLTGKAAAHIALFAAIGQVYGTRMIAISMRAKAEKSNGPTVVDMGGRPFPGQ